MIVFYGGNRDDLGNSLTTKVVNDIDVEIALTKTPSEFTNSVINDFVSFFNSFFYRLHHQLHLG